MGTIRRITDLQLGSIGTTKFLSITTASSIYTISSGNRALEITNLGPVTLYYGDTAVLAGSAGIIFSQSSKFWDTVVDDFTLGLVNNSAGISGLVIIQEYRGNN